MKIKVDDTEGDDGVNKIGVDIKSFSVVSDPIEYTIGVTLDPMDQHHFSIHFGTNFMVYTYTCAMSISQSIWHLKEITSASTMRHLICWTNMFFTTTSHPHIILCN